MPRRPRALPVGSPVMMGSNEFRLRNELIELRCVEPGDFGVAAQPLNDLEKSLRNMSTSPWHALAMHAEDN